VYRYVFTPPPAYHGAELRHIFRFGVNGPVTDLVSDTWIAFARNGAPHTAHAPEWPTYDTDLRSTTVIDETTSVVDDPFGDVRELWSSIDSTL